MREADPPMAGSEFPTHAVAIIGMAGRFPGATDLDGFWRLIRDGIEVLEPVSDADLQAASIPDEQRRDPRYVHKGTWLENARHWDAAFFGYSPREAQVIDPQQRLFLECAWEALEHAGYGARSGEEVVGVYGGASMNTWLLSQILRDPNLVASAGGYQLMLGNDKDFLCTRASYKLNLRGPSLTIQTACSTSLVAVEAACRALATGECDMALAGGVSISFPERTGYLHQEGMIFSRDGHCRPFDAAASGTRAGAGAGLVVLKRLADAARDRDTIHGVIRGIAINNDGSGKAGYTAPSLEGQAEVIATAQALAGVEPRSIGYVEAHGTATPLGDPIEIAALTAAFRAGTDDVGFCRLGSLKANLGHLDAAAGIAGLIKAVLVLKNGFYPPLVNFDRPNPALELATSPFIAASAGADWSQRGPRRAAVSSFGIGGTNAHAILEEAPPRQAAPESTGDVLLVLSAQTEAALADATVALADHLAATDPALADVAHTLAIGRTVFPLRRTVVAAGRDEAVRRLRAAAETPPARHEGGARPVAFLFPGQGSQHAGMGRALYDQEPVYRTIVDECAAHLRGDLGFDLRDLMFDQDGERLRSTAIAQPALFVTSYALARTWEARGVHPAALIGHSIGEYAAAALSGVLPLDDALTLVAARGRLMASMPPGAMAAVPLPADTLRPLLDPRVEIAAVNAPELCTISGPAADLDATLDRLAARGLEARRLATSHAFHSAMMEPILDAFEERVRRVPLSEPRIPYVSNVTGTWITAAEARDPGYYARQLRAAVLFADGIACLAADPSLFYLECGSGQALGQLALANLGTGTGAFVASSLPRAGGGEAATRTMLEATSKLWRAGVPVDLAAAQASGQPHRVPLPTYRFQRQLHDVQPTLGLPVPVADLLDQGIRYSAPTWMQDPAREPEGALSGRWLVQGGSARLRETVAGRLGDLGASVSALSDFADLRSALQMSSADDGLAGVLLLDGTAADAGSRLFEQLMDLAPVLDTTGRARPLHLVAACRGAAGVLDERVPSPDAALALGPVLVLPVEMRGLLARLVDVPQSDEAAARGLVTEAALQGEDAPFSAWRAGRRWLRRFEPFTPAQARPPLRQGGVYLITGGTGGIGLALAEWLAEQAGARVVLASRHAPGREDLEAGQDPRWAGLRRAIARIEAAGGEVLLARADAAEDAQMAAAVQAARSRWGALHGVIHAAGVAGPGLLAMRLPATDVAATLAPKRDGLAVLRRVLHDTALDFVVLMGSINGVLGAPGSSDYAAANAVLDAYAEFGERPSGWQRVVAIDWGPWQEVGMAHERRKAQAGLRDASHLPAGISPAQGVEAFAAVLGGTRDRVVVTDFDLEAGIAASRPSAFAALLDASEQPAAQGNAAANRPALSSAPALLEDATQLQLAAIWTQLIGIADLGADDDFFELGGHSLMATRLIARVEAQFGVRLSLRDVFEAPTIRSLAAKLSAALDHSPDEDREEIFL
jgi:phthiocerol/phenolphthiocerol synthesis type-I polyketide synthase E